MSNNYFNSTGTIGFTCDVCGRELRGCTWMNGMRFCAKCYQETFGTNMKEMTYVYGGNLKEHTKVIEEKDKQIADLKAKIAEQPKQIVEKIREKIVDYDIKYSSVVDVLNCLNLVLENLLKEMKSE